MRMIREHINRKFNENLDKFLKSFDNCVYKPDILVTYGAGWDDCQKEILKIIESQKGEWQEDMVLKYVIDKNILVKEIEKL